MHIMDMFCQLEPNTILREKFEDNKNIIRQYNGTEVEYNFENDYPTKILI